MLGLYSPEKILRIHHTPMCTPVHIHPPAHSRALSCIYMHTHIPAHSRAHLCTPAPTCIHPPTPTPTCPHRHMPAHSPANTHLHVHIREHPCTPNRGHLQTMWTIFWVFLTPLPPCGQTWTFWEPPSLSMWIFQ